VRTKPDNAGQLGILAAIALTIAACSEPEDSAPAYTLYRNSELDAKLRIHWATFGAAESDPAYNLNNCGMAARMLNANLQAVIQGNGGEPMPQLGFWCERGPFSAEGSNPSSFAAEFPTEF
jgi:hypothetical protein